MLCHLLHEDYATIATCSSHGNYPYLTAIREVRSTFMLYVVNVDVKNCGMLPPTLTFIVNIINILNV